MNYNETKFFILSVLEDLEEPVPWGIVQTWLLVEYNIELKAPAVMMALLRAHRQGLVHRKRGLYSISDRGRERLSWLAQTMQ